MAKRAKRTTHAGLIATIAHLENDCAALESSNEQLASAFNDQRRELDEAVKRAEHRAAQDGEDGTHAPASTKPMKIVLEAVPCGGFLITSGGREDYTFTPGVAGAFTTLNEALDWLRDNMARPAASKAT